MEFFGEVPIRESYIAEVAADMMMALTGQDSTGSMESDAEAAVSRAIALANELEMRDVAPWMLREQEADDAN